MDEDLTLLTGIDAAAVSEFDVVRGDVVFRAGEPSGDVFVVLAGKVKLTRGTSYGRDVIVALMGPGDQFGEAALFDPGPRSVAAVAVEDGRLARIDAGAVREAVAQRPDVADRLLGIAARRVRRSTEAVTDLMALDAPARVARHLLDLLDRFGDGARVAHGLTQEELAQLAGVTRETLNKILGDFAARGWVRCAERAMVVLRPDLLARRGRLLAGPSQAVRRAGPAGATSRVAASRIAADSAAVLSGR